MRRNVAIVALGAIAIVLLVWYLARSYGDHRNLGRLAYARARLAACLVGEPVDRHGADQTRLRAIQLAGAPDWPKRCATYAADVETALGSTRSSVAEPGPAVLEAGKLFEFYHLESRVAELLTPGEDEPTPDWAQATRGVPLPPTPVTLATEVGVVARSDYDVQDTGEHDLVLQFREEATCRFAASAGGLEPIARCSYPADALALTSGDWRLADSDAGADYVIASDGVRAFATGERVLASSWRADASVVNGAIYAWPTDAKLTTVARRAPDGKQSLLRVPVPSEGQLLRDQLIWHSGKRVVAASVAGDKLGPVVEVAKLDVAPVTGGCFTSGIVAVQLEVADDQYRLATFANDTWRVGEVGPRYALKCEGGKVVGLHTSRDDTNVKIDRIDCSSTGCATTTATVAGIDELYAVTAIGDATMLVWADTAIRAVTGPLAQLPTQKSVPLFDGFAPDHMNEKQVDSAMLVQGLHAFGRGSSAIVLFGGDGVGAIHVRDNKPERVQVVFE